MTTLASLEERTPQDVRDASATDAATPNDRASRTAQPPATAGAEVTSPKHSAFSGIDLAVFALIAAFMTVLMLAAPLAAMTRHPQAWEWGKRLVNRDRGLLQTTCLLIGAGAATFAAASLRRSGWRPRAALATAVLAAGGFLVVLGLDYDAKIKRGFLPGEAFRPNLRYVAKRFGVRLPRTQAQPAVAAAPAAAPVAARKVDAARGRQFFLNTCATCHGVRGEGMPGQGKPLRTSEFVAGLDDAALLKFVIEGRQPWDPANTTKVAMPGRGGNPMLKDDDIRDIVAYLRELQAAAKSEPAVDSGRQAGTTAAPGASASAAESGLRKPAAPDSVSVDRGGTSPSDTTPAVANANPRPGAMDGADAASARQASAAAAGEDLSLAKTAAIPLEIQLHRWVVPPAPPGPPGLDAAGLADLARPAWQPPSDGAAFFAGYYGATGVAGMAVLLAGAAALVCLMRDWRGGTTWRASARLTAATWWWVTACWLVVAPLFYL